MIKYKKMPRKSSLDIYNELYPDDKKGFKGLTFQVTEDCCLKCTYCYQTKKSKNKMTFEVAKKFIDSLLNDEYSCATRENTWGISCDFIGGEPLMEIDLIEQIMDYLITRMIELDHPWLYNTYFGICSNGILYQTPRVQKFFKKYAHMCGLAISIDGNKDLHDSCRIDLNGNGSYDRAIAAAHEYKEQYGSMPITKMTLAPQNIRYTSDAIKNLIHEGYDEIHLNCQFEDGWKLEHARIFYDQLVELTDYVINNELYDKIYISIFDENFFRPLDPVIHDENWCGGTTTNMIAVDYKGDLFPCIRYMDSSLNGAQPPILIGNVDRGYLASESDVKNIEKISNITRRSQSTDECYYCPIAAGCAWCSGLNYQETGSANCRVTHICIMHKARALANVYYWNKLYEHLGLDKKFINYVNDIDIDQIIVPKGDNDNGKQFVERFKVN